MNDATKTPCGVTLFMDSYDSHIDICTVCQKLQEEDNKFNLTISWVVPVFGIIAGGLLLAYMGYL